MRFDSVLLGIVSLKPCLEQKEGLDLDLVGAPKFVFPGVFWDMGFGGSFVAVPWPFTV